LSWVYWPLKFWRKYQRGYRFNILPPLPGTEGRLAATIHIYIAIMKCGHQSEFCHVRIEVGRGGIYKVCF